MSIFNPQVSKVSKGLEGKAILIYGDNSLGKTLQATRMERPFYLGFEMGIRGISGVPFSPINNWLDFKKLNAELTGKKTIDKAKELYQTIIFDEVFASARYCQDHICRINGAAHMGEQAPKGSNRPNLWTAYAAEYYGEIDKLLKSGYTIVFIGHEAKDNDTGQIIPKGDVRSMSVVRDNADITAYLTSNGVDENGKVIPSSAHFAATPDFFARSRFEYMDTSIEVFTAENLEKVIAEGIEREEKISGIDAISFEEQLEQQTSEGLDYDKILADLQVVCTTLNTNGFGAEMLERIGKRIPEGTKISEVKKTDVDILATLLLELKALEEALIS